MKLVLFDLDNTLLAGDSDYAWGQFLIEQGVLDRQTHEGKNREFYRQYQQGTLNIDDFLAYQLQALAGRPPEILHNWHTQFMQRHIAPMITPAARKLVTGALRDADLVAIVTATNSFVTRPIARAFGIEHLIATEPEMHEGRYTGRVHGTPSFREGKIARLDQWLAEQGKPFDRFDETHFYSDSHNDLPLLGRVSHPVAVNPDPLLLAHAHAHGWPILALHPTERHEH